MREIIDNLLKNTIETHQRVYDHNWLNLKFYGGGSQVESKLTSSVKNLLIFSNTTPLVLAQLMSRYCI